METKRTYLNTAARLLIHTAGASVRKVAAYLYHGTVALREKSWASFSINVNRTASIRYDVCHFHEGERMGTFIMNMHITLYDYFQSKGHFNAIPFDIATLDNLNDIFNESLLKGRGVDLHIGNSPLRLPHWAVVQLQPQFENALKTAKSQQFFKAVIGLED